MAAFLSSWTLIAKRSIAHWKLLSAVVLGVVFAVGISSSSIIYFQTLRALGLERDLAEIPPGDDAIQFHMEINSVDIDEYLPIDRIVDSVVDQAMGWMVVSQTRSGRSSTFYTHYSDGEAPPEDDRMRSSFSFLTNYEEHIEVVDGTLPQPLVIDDPDVSPMFEGIISVNSANLFGVGVGDVLTYTPFWDAATENIQVRIVGTFRPNAPDSRIWTSGVLRMTRQLSLLNAIPLLVPEETYFQGMAPLFPAASTTGDWLLETDTTRITPANAHSAENGLASLRLTLSGRYRNFQMDAPMQRVLETFQTKLFFMRVPLMVVTLMMVAVVLYYVVLLANLLVGRQQGEIALIQSRGASRRQILLIFAMEGVLLSTLGFVLGPLVATGGIAILGLTPAFSPLSGGQILPVHLTTEAFQMALVGALLAQAMLLLPAVKATRLGVVHFRQELARPVQAPFYQRYYLDVALLVVTAVLLWQLSNQRTLVVTDDLFGELQVDQLLLLVPSVFLLAMSLLFLRLFPLFLALLVRVVGPIAPVWFSLGLWELARNPSHYSRLVLLLMMAAGLGVFAASFGGTLERSYRERALYEAGGDLRVTGVGVVNAPNEVSPVEAYAAVNGVIAASPVLRGGGSVMAQAFGGGYSYMAVDPETFADIAWFRDDFARESFNGLMTTLEEEMPPIGIPLPAGSESLSLWVQSIEVDPTTSLFLQIKDGNGRYISYVVSELTFQGWRQLEVDLSTPTLGFRSNTNRVIVAPAEPIQLQSVFVFQRRRQGGQASGTVLLDDIQAVKAGGESVLLEGFEGEIEWGALRPSSLAARDSLDHSTITPSGTGKSLAFLWQEGSVVAVRGIGAGYDRTPVPAVASRTFLSEFGHKVGEDTRVSAYGQEVIARIEHSADYFPTLDPVSEEFLIIPLNPILDRVNLTRPFDQIQPTEFWMRVEPGTNRRELTRDLRTGPFAPIAITDREALLAESQADPLVAAGWGAILLIAYLTVLLLSVIGFVVHAYVSAQQRRLSFAALRSLGLSVGQLVGVVWLEQAMIIGIGLAFGTWMGNRIGSALVPFLGITEGGTQVLPPFIIETSWGAVALTYLGMGILFAITIGLVIWVFSRLAISRALRASEI